MKQRLIIETVFFNEVPGLFPRRQRKGQVLFFSVAIMVGFGLLLDRWLHTSPWFAVGGIVFGTVAGFYEFFRISSRLS